MFGFGLSKVKEGLLVLYMGVLYCFMIIAFITEREPIVRIPRYVGEPDHAPEVPPARGPPEFYLELDQRQAWSDDVIDPVPEFEYDQTVSSGSCFHQLHKKPRVLLDLYRDSCASYSV